MTTQKEMPDKYKAQLVIGPSGNEAIATPLFFINHAVDMDKMEGHSMVLCKPEPLAFALEYMVDGVEQVTIVNANVVFEQCEFLGAI